MNLEPLPALELAAELLLEGPVGPQPRHLVLVLVGQELVVVARHGLGELRALGQAGGLQPARPLDQRAVAGRVGGVLVVGEEGRPPLDHLVEAVREATMVGQRRGRRREFLDPLQVVRRLPAPEEGRAVELDRRTVELDRAQDRLLGQGHQPLLPGDAQHEHVGRDGIAHQRRGEPGGVEEGGAVGAHRIDHLVFHGLGREFGVAETVEIARAGLLGHGAHKLAGDRRVAVDHGMGAPELHLGQRLVADRDHDVAADDGIGLAGGDARRPELVGCAGDPHMRPDRTALLGQTRHVEGGDALALEMGRHREDGADRHHAGAADPGGEARRRGADRALRLVELPPGRRMAVSQEACLGFIPLRQED